MYLATFEKYIYVSNTEICKKETIELESLDSDYLENRLSWYKANNWKLGCIWKLAAIENPEWDEVDRAIRKALNN